MSHTEDQQEKVWELAEKIGFCVLSTQSGMDLKARPMSAYAERAENAFYLLADVRAMSMRKSRVILMSASPSSAEYWHSTGTVISYIRMAAAAVTNSKPDMGVTAKVEM